MIIKSLNAHRWVGVDMVESAFVTSQWSIAANVWLMVNSQVVFQCQESLWLFQKAYSIFQGFIPRMFSAQTLHEVIWLYNKYVLTKTNCNNCFQLIYVQLQNFCICLRKKNSTPSVHFNCWKLCQTLFIFLSFLVNILLKW